MLGLQRVPIAFRKSTHIGTALVFSTQGTRCWHSSCSSSCVRSAPSVFFQVSKSERISAARSEFAWSGFKMICQSTCTISFVAAFLWFLSAACDCC